jgi:hypothetical protein
VTTVQIINAIAAEFPAADLPTIEILDHAIALAHEWMDLDIMSEDGPTSLAAPRLHPELSLPGADEDSKGREKLAHAIHVQQQQQQAMHGARRGSAVSSTGTGAVGAAAAAASASASGSGLVPLAATETLELRFSAMQRQNDELKARLDMVIKLLSAQADARNGGGGKPPVKAPASLK